MATARNLIAKTKLETQNQIVFNAWEQGLNDVQISKITELPQHDVHQFIEKMIDEKKRRQEFREWITPNIKAEFIDGEVIVHSPVRSRHWEITDYLGIVSAYVKLHNLGRVGTEKVMIALKRNDYEPDLVFFCKEKADKLNKDQVLFPAPDLAVEILSKSTAYKDKGKKKRDYAAAGISEYWIIDPDKEIIEQYLLFSPKDTVYAPVKVLDLSHAIQSRVINGFLVPVIAFFDHDENVEALKEIMKG